MKSPAPGFCRRIKLQAGPNVICAGLEDDYHRFALELHHKDGIIQNVHAIAQRYPWSTCQDAGSFLARELPGFGLSDIASLDIKMHCTHLFELGLLCAQHKDAVAPLQVDVFVADRTDDRTFATLHENGELKLRWDVQGMVIVSPAPYEGRNLRQLSEWKKHLSPDDVLRALQLRRALHISLGRQIPVQLPVKRTLEWINTRHGACYTYQRPQIEQAEQTRFLREDFSRSGKELLKGYSPFNSRDHEP